VALAQIKMGYYHKIWLEGLMKAAKYPAQGNRGISR